MRRNIEVCLSPAILSLCEPAGKTVVVVDILRATSCMTTAMAHGVKEIIPVASLEECKLLQKKGILAAAERDGMKIEGFDLDNSPFSYMDPDLKDKSIAVTTTNGTQVIVQSKEAAHIVIGSFLNERALIEYIISQPNDVIIACAGWKGKVNLEDSLFAGSLITKLENKFNITCDSALAAKYIYQVAKDDKKAFLKNSSHVNRLKKLHIEKDIDFCLTSDVYDVVPILVDGKINSYSHQLASKVFFPSMK